LKAEEYKKLSEKATGNSPILLNCILAFIIGGLICTLGQFIFDMIKLLTDLDKEKTGTLTSIILIFLSALFTGLGLYEKLAKYGGAGTLVPITGFANAMVSPAIEFKTEGFILGTGPKLFTIAGPVIVYGTIASVVYGIIYYIIKCL
jgi:stage V sporulation protein AC